jgi:hypothetical protein
MEIVPEATWAEAVPAIALERDLAMDFVHDQLATGRKAPRPHHRR